MDKSARLGGELSCSLILALLLAATTTEAAEIRVRAGEVAIIENGRCSLREAIINAQADDTIHSDCRPGDGADVIILAPDSLYQLDDPVASGFDVGLPGISTTITIEGHGSTIRRGNHPSIAPFRILTTSNADLTLRDLTLEGGRFETALHFEGGGAIWMRGGKLLAERVRFIDNGVHPNGRGGAIYMSSGSGPGRVQATLRDCLFTGNHVDSVPGQHTTGGGAINVETGDLVVERCAFVGNRTRRDPTELEGGGGGAIVMSDLAGSIDGHPYGTTAVIRDSTLSGNRAGAGGAIHVQSVQGFWLSLFLANVTMVNNVAMGPVKGITANAVHPGGQIDIGYTTSILHGNGSSASDRDCVTTGGMSRVRWESHSGNLLGPGRGCPEDPFGDDFLDANVWAHIESALVDHGYELKPGSVMVDVVSGSLCDHGVSRDQRGRIRGGGQGQGGVHCDIGATEFYGKVDDTIFGDGFESGG